MLRLRLSGLWGWRACRQAQQHRQGPLGLCRKNVRGHTIGNANKVIEECEREGGGGRERGEGEREREVSILKMDSEMQSCFSFLHTIHDGKMRITERKRNRKRNNTKKEKKRKEKKRKEKEIKTAKE